MYCVPSVLCNWHKLLRYVHKYSRKKIGLNLGDFTQLLASLQTAVKAVSAAVRRAGISDMFGVVGNVNVQVKSVWILGSLRIYKLTLKDHVSNCM